MLRTFCKSKVMNAKLTSTELYYNGSIGIDKDIIEAADIMPGEQVHVLNVNNGERIITYVIEEASGSGKVILYGPAARKGHPEDKLVILSYCMVETKESHGLNMRVVNLDENNQCKGK
jgi:aspartate 1-decarboxylase